MIRRWLRAAVADRGGEDRSAVPFDPQVVTLLHDERAFHPVGTARLELDDPTIGSPVDQRLQGGGDVGGAGGVDGVAVQASGQRREPSRTAGPAIVNHHPAGHHERSQAAHGGQMV